MRKILLLTFCLFFTASAAFSAERKKDSNFGGGRQSQKQDRQSRDTSARNDYGSRQTTQPARHTQNENRTGSGNKAKVSSPAPKQQTNNTVSRQRDNSRSNSVNTAKGLPVPKQQSNNTVNRQRDNNRGNSGNIAKGSPAPKQQNNNTVSRQRDNNRGTYTSKSNNINANRRENQAVAASQSYKIGQVNNTKSYKAPQTKTYNTSRSHTRQTSRRNFYSHYHNYSWYYPYNRYYSYRWYYPLLWFLYPVNSIGYYYSSPYPRVYYNYSPTSYLNYSYPDDTAAATSAAGQEMLYYKTTDMQEESFFTSDISELNDIKLQNTRLVTEPELYIGFVVNNASSIDISAISFSVTIREPNNTRIIEGIFYKLGNTLNAGDKKYYTIALNGMDLDLPESYSVFAEVESITTPDGITIDK